MNTETNTNTTPNQLPNAICYLKVNRKDFPIYKCIKEIEKFCYEKYTIIDWYIDIVEDKKAINPALCRLMNNIFTCHNLCDVIITLNKNQLSMKTDGKQACNRIFNSVGIDWVTIENKFVCRDFSVVDTVNNILLSDTNHKIKEIEAEIKDIENELD